METSKPSITRLARRAGIKSLSESCFPTIRKIMDWKIEEILKTALIINSERQTKTLMTEDLYEAVSLSGVNLTQSSALRTKVNK